MKKPSWAAKRCGVANAICGVAGEDNVFIIKPMNEHGVPQDLSNKSVTDAFDAVISLPGNSFGRFLKRTIRPGEAMNKIAREQDDLRVRGEVARRRITYKIDGTVDPYELNVTLDGATPRVRRSSWSAPARGGEGTLFSTQTRGEGYDSSRMRDNTPSPARLISWWFGRGISTGTTPTTTLRRPAGHGHRTIERHPGAHRSEPRRDLRAGDQHAQRTLPPVLHPDQSRLRAVGHGERGRSWAKTRCRCPSLSSRRRCRRATRGVGPGHH